MNFVIMGKIMTIASMVCGIAGLSGLYICGRRILFFVLQALIESSKSGLTTLVFEDDIKIQMAIFPIFGTSTIAGIVITESALED